MLRGGEYFNFHNAVVLITFPINDRLFVVIHQFYWFLARSSGAGSHLVLRWSPLFINALSQRHERGGERRVGGGGEF